MKVSKVALAGVCCLVLSGCKGQGNDVPPVDITTPPGVSMEQDVEPEKVPVNQYQTSLGLDAERDPRVEIVDEPDPEPEPEPEPVQTEPNYETVVTIFDNTSVPEKNMDGSSCKDYLSKVKLTDFGTMWGSSLTEDDFFSGNRCLVGTEQQKGAAVMGDLQSTGWLISNLDTLGESDAIRFTNLHVIGSLSDSHVALLCSYDWYSYFGLTDTLVVFEDISDTLKVADFKDGDIFSATVYKHNVKVEKVEDKNVVVVQYAIFE